MRGGRYKINFFETYACTLMKDSTIFFSLCYVMLLLQKIMYFYLEVGEKLCELYK